MGATSMQCGYQQSQECQHLIKTKLHSAAYCKWPLSFGVEAKDLAGTPQARRKSNSMLLSTIESICSLERARDRRREVPALVPQWLRTVAVAHSSSCRENKWTQNLIRPTTYRKIFGIPEPGWIPHLIRCFSSPDTITCDCKNHHQASDLAMENNKLALTEVQWHAKRQDERVYLRQAI